MIVLTPNPRFSFVTRDESPSDVAVIREAFVENVYQIHPGDLDRPGAVFLDIGANIGAVSVYAAGLSEQVRVIAVEPEPHNLDLLSKNLLRNEVAHRVDVCEMAVTDDPHRSHAFVTNEHGNSKVLDDDDGVSAEIHTTNLDALFGDIYRLAEVDVCKIDVEGSEYEIIAAADIATLWKIRYLTMEFDAADDARFGAMIAKLAKVFNIHVIGSPERGGYLYGRRY